MSRGADESFGHLGRRSVSAALRYLANAFRPEQAPVPGKRLSSPCLARPKACAATHASPARVLAAAD